MLTKTEKVTNLQANFKSLIIAGFLASITLTPAADAMGILAKFANLATKFSQQKSLDKLAINKPAIFFAKNTPVNNSQIKILDFDYARDAKAIINLYDQNWNLLDEPELKELCSEIVNSKLKLVTKEKNPRHLYAGKLITKVLHYND